VCSARPLPLAIYSSSITARTTMALCIAASLASGLKANFGTMTKPLHIGQWRPQWFVGGASG